MIKLLILSTLIIGMVMSVDWDVIMPLDEYVAKDDGYFSYDLILETPYENYTYYVLNMTSQKWKNESHTTTPIWFHYVSVIVLKDEIQFKESASIMIEGGRQSSSPPTPENDLKIEFLVELALSTKSIVAMLKMVPNQPIVYMDDAEGKRRTEDDSIAYTWKRFVEYGGKDPEMLLQFPMTKAAVKALDAVNLFVAELDSSINLNKFAVTGGSKRGWITWLLGAVDKRVNIMAPIVLTAVNFQANLNLHYRAYGGWSFALNDYYHHNFTQHLNDPLTAEMMRHIDPYNYRERYTMPKIIISACGDEFFRPEDSHAFFGELPEPKYMLLLANAQHTVIGSYDRIYNTLESFFLAVNTGFQLPTLRWERSVVNNNGILKGHMRLISDSKPYHVVAQVADTIGNERKDFRLIIGTPPFVNPVLWDEEAVREVDNGVWEVEFDEEEDTFVGFFIEAMFNGPRNGTHFDLTTEIQVVPEEYPFPPCEGDECRGELV